MTYTCLKKWERHKKRRKECISGRENYVGKGMEAEVYLVVTGNSEENFLVIIENVY